MKKTQKEELRTLSIEKLEINLNELEMQKMKLEMAARNYLGDLRVPMTVNRNMNSMARDKVGYDIKGLRHKIACVASIINEKIIKRLCPVCNKFMENEDWSYCTYECYLKRANKNGN